MKKKIGSLLVLAILVTSTTFAGDIDNNVTKEVSTAFSKEFTKASEVAWEKTATFYKATFLLNGQYLFAYYSPSGEKMAVARNLSSIELPIYLQADLRDNYSGYWISELFEYANGDGSKYYVTLENSDDKIILESVNTNYWSIYKKIANDQ